ncbi:MULTISPECIES: plasmid SOS inhibition protein A [Pantoea]|uniref:plasmid SOS inhibition protein A n=1 Tax=Pantoea TaxID=53335 RepID=UPI0035BF3FF1
MVFHSPETVGSWVSRWSDSQVNHYALEGMFYRWSEHFSSMKQLDRWTLKGEPLWRLSVEARFLSDESTQAVRGMDTWLVPNKPKPIKAA